MSDAKDGAVSREFIGSRSLDYKGDFMKCTNFFGVALGMAIVTLTACQRERAITPVNQPGVIVPPTTIQPSTNAATAVPGTQGQAASQIAQARCARETRCGNVGPGKDHATQAECLSKTNTEWREDLNARDCPGGIVMKELSECLEEIRNDDCGNPLDTIGRVLACRESDLCKRT